MQSNQRGRERHARKRWAKAVRDRQDQTPTSGAHESIVRALDALEQVDPQIATILTLHYFGNQSAKPLTMEQIAEQLEISKTTVFNRIEKGKMWIGEWLKVNAPDVLWTAHA